MKKLFLVFGALALAPAAHASEYPNERFGGLRFEAPLAVAAGGVGNSSGDASRLSALVGGSRSPSLAAHFGETIDLLDYATGVVQGNGVVDDGPMFRAALAACTAGNGMRRLHIPSPPSVWNIKSLDPSGLGALVIGNGTSDPSCWLDGDAPSTVGGYLGGVNIKLGPALNRPLVYVRAAAASPIFSNMRLDGNKSAQSGWSGGPGGKLYTFQIADDASGGTAQEGAAQFYNVWIEAGYNGNLYQGWGRGMLWSQNLWLLFSGQASDDYSYVANGYDATHLNIQVGENTGGGILLGFGGQYQFKGGAVFQNSADGMTLNGGRITYSDIEGMNVQDNGCNGVTVKNVPPLKGEQPEGHTYRGVVFDGNSHTTAGACNDFNNLGSTIELLVAPVFGGASSKSANRAGYNVYDAASAKTAVIGPVFGNGASSTIAFTNDFTKIVLNQFGVVNVGNVAPTNSGFMFTVNDSRQFYGQLWTNGTNSFAAIGGSSSTNDDGLFKLLNGGVPGVQLSASGFANYITGNIGFGGETSPKYPVDVSGEVNATSGYRAGGVAGVSCAAGAVNLSTFTVTNGIVTHC